MTVATRAPFTGAFAAPAIPTTTLTSAPNGGNNPWVVASAFQHEGVTYLGYVDGAGDIEVVSIANPNNVVSGPYTIHASYQQDVHASPVIHRRSSDGRLIVVYALHGPGQQDIRVRVSTNPDDASSWDAAVNIHSQLGGDEYADYQLWEHGGYLWLVFRHEQDGVLDSYWSLSKTLASAPTSGWTTRGTIYRVPGVRSYPVTCLDPATGRLHWVVTNGSDTDYTKLGHFYHDLDTDTYHKSDGTDISALRPFDFSEITEAYSGTRLVFGANVAIDPDGHPVVAAWDTIAASQRYIYARWDGAAWSSTNVASGAPGYAYNAGDPAADWNPYGSCIDDRDPNDMWVIEGVAGQPEVVRYRTRDGGTTFERRQVTSGSSGLLFQLIPVRSPHRSLRVFWHEGTWADYIDWSAGLRGAGG